MAESFTGIKYQKVVLEEVKTASQLLDELKLDHRHVVLVNGKRVDPEFVIRKSDQVIILPLIQGG